MCCSSHLPFSIFWGPCLVIGSLGIASSAALGAPGGACLASSARKVARLGAAAETAQATGQGSEAWRSIRDAVSAARRGGCLKHRSLGRAYLVLGIIEHGNSRFTRMHSAWQRALRLDRTLVLDNRFTNLRLRRAFRRLKMKMFPAAARPRPRPRPQPGLADPAATTPPGPRVSPPPGPRVSPPPGSPLRPVARPQPRQAPNPYGSSRASNRSSGCGSDNDCKGDRVCDRGRCVYPRNSRGRAPVVTPVRRYPSPPPPPILRKGKPRYSEKGTVELGLGIGFQWSETSTTIENNTNKTELLRFSLDLYLAYFVARRFKVGFYFSVPFTKSSYTDDYGDNHKYTSWEVDLIFAPGFVFPFSPTVFGFIDFLIGFAAIGGDTGVGDDEDLIMGAVGGELGIKVLLGTHMLMKIGLRPLYLFGKTKIDVGYENQTIQFDDTRVVLTLGFSAFW